ncbi:MAG: GNAT family N-acetyltransferase [Candidatus Thermoplasmatota archaeon]|nr:GNAT family N-acetyltransferase [Candidatus Thermoplasmatota archaeon]
MRIRKCDIKDVYTVYEILKENDQIGPQSVDHPKALKRIIGNNSAIFLVAEVNNKVVGMVRGVWDGSRALIHQISVHPLHQRIRIGTELVKKIAVKFRDMGAPTISVTASERSSGFFKKLGFRVVPTARLMLHEDINKVIKI